MEHIYPDYSLYPNLPHDTAYGFLTRGCPRACRFCIVAEKEGRAARKVADLSEWWRGQKHIKLLDPNLLACPEHMDLMAGQDLTEHFRRFKELSSIKDYRKLGVYVLANYEDGETPEEKVENALRRINPLRDLGYNPHVMIYDKPNAPIEIRRLQRWCNNRWIFGTVPDFYGFDPRRR